MKVVVIRDSEVETDIKSRNIFKMVLETNGGKQQALSVDDIRKRCRILDKLESATDKLYLEDLDHLTLKHCIENFPWAVAKPQLLQIIDDVINAEKVTVKVVNTQPETAPMMEPYSDDSGKQKAS